MDEPTHLRGTLKRKGREIEFYYSAWLRWSCTRCGRCCRDVEGWERRVLLLDCDVKRLEETGATEFSDPVEEGRFNAVMRKKDGVCVLYRVDGCTVYEDRALLCRMYPFYVEREGDVYVIGVDPTCPGVGGGEALGEGFYAELLAYALDRVEG
ncbi:YkgJ family cysteine cluster protein [Candidatus Bathyarchaeota archaeon]|nr:YkgJ family cysteine cluster protein [Candidatus Bathyarchaeota archaeon]